MEHESIPAFRPAGASLSGEVGRPSPFTQDASSPPKTPGDGEQFSFNLKKPAALKVRFKQGKGAKDDVLFCPTLREHLQARPSPFVESNYFGGGFVSDGDRVHIASLVHSEDDNSSRVFDYRDSHENLEALARLAATPSFRRGMAAQRAQRAAWGSPPSSGGGGSPLGRLEEEEGGEEEREITEMPRFALRAGPRETIYFNPQQTRIAIVTVGSLCPGQNDVVRAIVSKACDYGVPEGCILGVRFGFRGFEAGGDQRYAPMQLTRAGCDEIHLEGGTVLGTSSGDADVQEVVKWLDLKSIDMLFVVGGLKAQSVASEIRRKCAAHNVVTSVVTVPKSIDSDFLLVDRTFGFDTAVDEAQRALQAAKVEASSAYRGIGLVMLGGKESGFIAVKASLASGLVDVCLIPEAPFQLEGPGGLLAYLEHLLETRGHAVVCIAEGAAQGQIPEDFPRNNTSSELKDSGAWLKAQIKKALKDVDLKLIDPSYLIRSVPPNSNDRVYCVLLGHGAVHAAFAGYTGVLVGMVNTHYVLLPIIDSQAPRKVDPRGALWTRLCASTGQPSFNGS